MCGCKNSVLGVAADIEDWEGYSVDRVVSREYFPARRACDSRVLGKGLGLWQSPYGGESRE